MKRTKIWVVYGCIFSFMACFGYFSYHFLDVEGYDKEGKVHCDLVFTEMTEPFVVHVGFHLSEYGFGFDATSSSMY